MSGTCKECTVGLEHHVSRRTHHYTCRMSFSHYSIIEIKTSSHTSCQHSILYVLSSKSVDGKRQSASALIYIYRRKTCDPQVTQRGQKPMQSRPSSWGLINKAGSHPEKLLQRPKFQKVLCKNPECFCVIGLFWPLNYLKHLDTIWIKSFRRIQIPEFQIIQKLSGL